MRHFNTQILAHYSGLLITIGTVAAGYIFMPDIHAFIHPQSPIETKTPEAPQQSKGALNETEPYYHEDSRSASPVSQTDSEPLSRSSLSIIIVNEDEMVDIEAELESKLPKKEIDISSIFDLFEAIEDHDVDIPGKKFATTLRYMMRQTYFYQFFGIAHEKLFKSQVEEILKIIETARDTENTQIHIPQCYQLFRQDEFYRINHLLQEPKPQSPFTPLF